MLRAMIRIDEPAAPIVFAAEQLKLVLLERNIEVVWEASYVSPASSEPIRFELATLNSLQADVGPLPSLDPEGYVVRIQQVEGQTLCRVIGADATGTMYGGLDVAEAIRHGETIDELRDYHKNPFISRRGIKFNIPLDARTPSYSDNGDAAQHNIAEMWSKPFWEEFLDQMALHRFNTLSLWNLHPFPSMVQVPEYPDIALQDVKRTTVPFKAEIRGQGMSTAETLSHLTTVKEMSIAEKISFWREVMQYASDRGVQIYIITWNIFTYGTEGNRYGIDDRQNNETTIDYFRASVRSLLETYPLLAGIGVTAGENMQHLESPYSDEEWLWRTYGEAVMDIKRDNPERRIHFIHRAHETSLSTIKEAFRAYPDTFTYSYKYSLAHMYSSVTPPFIYKDGFIRELPKGNKTWLTVRDDDFYYFRWGNPEFARQYILGMPPSDQLAGFYMGPDGIIWGREFVSTEPDSPRQSMIAKLWYCFSIWGRLSYDPALPDQLFVRQLGARYPEVGSRPLYEAWTTASKIIPLVTTFHWKGNSLDFQWYPEACYSNPGYKGFHTVEHFIEDAPMPDSGLMGIPEYVDHLRSQRPMWGITPLQVVDDLHTYARRTLQLIDGIGGGKDKELRLLLGDLQAMSFLGHYYAAKIKGAVELHLYRTSSDLDCQRRSMEYLLQASAYWKEYASLTAKQYVPQILTRQGSKTVDVQQLSEQVDKDITIAAGNISQE
ncbi:carbohydrate-binding family 6 protein [Paenibacillus piri]|uniref:Carbohydrate-binding family 6 protein n=1 Tax=Paenibacillus piri TaxID=2547395 RepID=A0A4R5KD04_9BACL|nr:carbohydrate-binding family 6 protein [Paenibacillus piri]TDF92752.1 carbohydrate-binding family 6 protein [Paenibacillus piri]